MLGQCIHAIVVSIGVSRSVSNFNDAFPLPRNNARHNNGWASRHLSSLTIQWGSRAHEHISAHDCYMWSNQSKCDCKNENEIGVFMNTLKRHPHCRLFEWTNRTLKLCRLAALVRQTQLLNKNKIFSKKREWLFIDVHCRGSVRDMLQSTLNVCERRSSKMNAMNVKKHAFEIIWFS